MYNIILDWLKEWQFWMVLISIIGGVFAAYKYLNDTHIKSRQQEFDNYFKLVEKIYDENPYTYV